MFCEISNVFSIKMNPTFLTRCIFKNKCRNYMVLKHMTSEYAKMAAITPPDITSKFYSTNNKDRPKTSTAVFEVCKRLLSSDSGPPAKRLPPLMNFPEIVWPSLFKSIRNFILATFIIKPYMDRQFNIPDFVRGSKKAVEVVSNKLSEGDMKSLDGLVASEIVPDLHKAISIMSLSQREQLAINVEDIYFSFPYQVHMKTPFPSPVLNESQVGVIFNDKEGKDHKRFVEITMVYHTMRGLAAMRSRGEEPPLNMGMIPEYQGRISVCNYRFIKEFTKGVESDWTVNVLNHFKPADYLE